MGAVQGVNVMYNLFVFLQYYAQNLNTQVLSHMYIAKANLSTSL